MTEQDCHPLHAERFSDQFWSPPSTSAQFSANQLSDVNPATSTSELLHWLDHKSSSLLSSHVTPLGPCASMSFSQCLQVGMNVGISDYNNMVPRELLGSSDHVPRFNWDPPFDTMELKPSAYLMRHDQVRREAASTPVSSVCPSSSSSAELAQDDTHEFIGGEARLGMAREQATVYDSLRKVINDEINPSAEVVKGKPPSVLIKKPEKRGRRKGQKRLRQPRVALITKSEVEHLEDGFRWRKYGQKAVKNSPYPRSYYRCTNSKCSVKKRIERSSKDPSMVITTYEGQHNHHSPAQLGGNSCIPPTTVGVHYRASIPLGLPCSSTFSFPSVRLTAQAERWQEEEEQQQQEQLNEQQSQLPIRSTFEVPMQMLHTNSTSCTSLITSDPSLYCQVASLMHSVMDSPQNLPHPQELLQPQFPPRSRPPMSLTTTTSQGLLEDMVSGLHAKS